MKLSVVLLILFLFNSASDLKKIEEIERDFADTGFKAWEYKVQGNTQETWVFKTDGTMNIEGESPLNWKIQKGGGHLEISDSSNDWIKIYEIKSSGISKIRLKDPSKWVGDVLLDYIPEK